MTKSATSQPSPLPFGRIEAYFLGKLQYEINPRWDANGPENPLTIDLGVRVQKAGKPGRYQTIVLVKLGLEDPSRPGPYAVEAEAIVLLDGMPSQHADEEELIKHVAMICGPLGFGAVREELLNLSAKGPYPRLLIPLVPARALVESAVAHFKSESAPAEA